MNNFRFGIVAAQSDSASSWTGLARKVESLGFSSLLVPDTQHTLSPAVACAVAATATSSLHVGPYVLAASNRTSGQVAVETQTLHVLTDGRYQLGIGAGRDGSDHDAAALGMPFGSPSERIAAVVATVRAVRARSPETRVLIAGSGPRMLRTAGAIADTAALGLPPRAGTDELAVAVAHVGAGEAERMGKVELSLNLLCVGDQAPPWLAQYMTADIDELVAAGSVSVLTGSVSQMVDTLVERRERFGVSYICTHAAFVDALAPVVQQLAGR
jgi:alkanesulfonate monooxygenase SsuD/methylene tetrahydromethanopterin reductase-like flavin-dependent oxidoreductase (luciferase family)